MNIIFVGTMVPNEIEAKEDGISSAGNRFQNNFIKHLEDESNNVKLLSYLAIGVSCDSENALPNWVTYNPAKKIDRIKAFSKQLQSEVKKADIVICYNVIYAWLFLPVYAKRHNKKSVVILADYSGEESYSDIGHKLYAKLMLWSVKKFNKVVGLSCDIEKKLVRNQEFVLMEGGIDEELYEKFSDVEDAPEIKNYMYSGLLAEVTGVDVLLEAMKLNSEDITLTITGKGPLEGAVKSASEVDARIRYLGSLPYDEYIEELKHTDALINPRNMKLPENQNNFPSKVMDYLATGKPIISTKFAGWKNFEENISFIDSTAEAISNALKVDNVRKSSVHNNRARAKDFLWSRQIEKIIG